VKCFKEGLEIFDKISCREIIYHFKVKNISSCTCARDFMVTVSGGGAT